MVEVERAYACIMSSFAPPPVTGTEPSLGGMLFYSGQLDATGRAFTVAGNLAGAAVLTVTADPEVQRQAVRQGIVDFLVTSLDEALRILKNEIRKREAVAVCIGAVPEDVECEMTERGVAPNLVRDAALRSICASEERILGVRWTVESQPARWLPWLDAIASECLPATSGAAHRWLRLAPRYLGRLLREERFFAASPEFAQQFLENLRTQSEKSQIPVALTVSITDGLRAEAYRFMPAAPRVVA